MKPLDATILLDGRFDSAWLVNEGVLLKSVIFVFSEPSLVIVGPWDEDISVVGFVASIWEVKSVSVAVVSELDRAVGTFHESCDLGPFGGIVVLMPVSTREG